MIDVNILPSGYKQLEYIESTGNQFINTGVYVTSKTKIKLDFMYLGSAYNGWTVLYGSRGSAVSSYFALFFNVDGSYLTDPKISPNYGNFDPGNDSPVRLVANLKYRLETNGGDLMLDGGVYSNVSTSNTITTSEVPFYLLAVGTTSGAQNRNICARIYSFRMYEDKKLIRHMIPAKRISDGQIGLYDLITNKLYISEGTEAFVEGTNIYSDNIVTKPEDRDGFSWYRREEYLLFTGNQYIDTGIAMNIGTYEYVIETAVEPEDSTNINLCVAGCGDAQWNGPLMMNLCNNKMEFGSMGYSAVGSYTPKARTEFVARVKSTSQSFYKDGQLILSGTATYSGSNYTLYIGNFNAAGTVNSAGVGFKGKMYYFRIYRDNVLVRNYIPCRDGSGRDGVYDTISKTFYLPEGSLFAGYEVKMATYREVDYIEFNGSQYITTDIRPGPALTTEITITPDSSYLSEYSIFGSSWSAAGYFLMFYNNQVRFHSRNYVCDVSNFNKSGKNIITTYSQALGSILLNINDTNYPSTSTAGSQAEDSSGYIQIAGDFGYGSSKRGHFKLHKFRVWYGSVLVRDFVPCIKLSNNTYGLFDKIDRRFYPATSGTLSGGATKQYDGSLKLASKPLNNNRRVRKLGYGVMYPNGYIDTGVYPNHYTKIRLKVNINADNLANNAMYLYGSGNSAGDTAFECYYWDGALQFNYGNQMTFAIPAPTKGVMGAIIEQDGNKVSLEYGTKKYTYSFPENTALDCPYSLAIGALHRASILTPSTYIQFERCQIWTYGTLARDYSFAEDMETKQIGIYDRVRKNWVVTPYRKYLSGASMGEVIMNTDSNYELLEYVITDGFQRFNFPTSTSTTVGKTGTFTHDVEFILDGTRQLVGGNGNTGTYWGVNASGNFECEGDLGISAGGRHTIKFTVYNDQTTANKLEIDGNVVREIVSTQTDPGNYSATSLSAGSYKCKMKIYKLEGSSKEFVPARRLSDGTIGFIDLTSASDINKIWPFYVPTNNSSFIPGPTLIDRQTIYCNKVRYEVKELYANDTLVYEKDPFLQTFKFIGLDSAGVAEDEEGFNGEIVAYRLDDFSSDYYTRLTTSGKGDDNYVTPLDITDLEIPDYYNRKPVTQLGASIFRSHTSGQSPQYYVGCNMWSVKFNNFIKTLPSSWGQGAMYAELPNDIEKIEAGGLYCGNYGCNWRDSELSAWHIPTSVKSLTACGCSGKYVHLYSPDLTLALSGSVGPFDGNTNSWSAVSKGIIFESSVKSISGCLLYSSTIPIVFKHGVNDDIAISITTKPKSALSVTIYTDCNAVKNYDWASINYTVTFKSLSEWSET